MNVKKKNDKPLTQSAFNNKTNKINKTGHAP